MLKAQCPTDVPPTGGGWPAWTHAAAPIWVSVPGCDALVDYCYRVLTGWPTSLQTTYQAVVISIDSSSSNCGSENTRAFFSAITDAVQHDDLSRVNANILPPCNDNTSVDSIEMWMPSCWKMTQTSPSRHFIPCGGAPAGYCVNSCAICENNGSAYTFGCVDHPYGSPNCSLDAPTTLSGWNTTDCVHVPCGSTP
ncbi:MAG: hypothetical protein ABI778_00695 [Ignavibacteriota bacterium]